MKYGVTLKPYSDCTASAGTTAARPGRRIRPGRARARCSLSSATTVSTRSSVPCTLDTAEAPSEWPMIATRVVRPGRHRAPVGRAVEQLPAGVEAVTVASPRRRVAVAAGAASRGRSSSASCGADHEVRVLLGGHARAAEVLTGAGGAKGLQNGSAFDLVVLVRERLAGALALHVVGEHHVAALGQVLGEPPVHPLEPWTDPVVITTPGNGRRSRGRVYGSRAPGSGAKTSPRISAP